MLLPSMSATGWAVPSFNPFQLKPAPLTISMQSACLGRLLPGFVEHGLISLLPLSTNGCAPRSRNRASVTTQVGHTAGRHRYLRCQTTLTVAGMSSGLCSRRQPGRGLHAHGTAASREGNKLLTGGALIVAGNDAHGHVLTAGSVAG